MKHTTIRGGRKYLTHWYYGHDGEGNVLASTREGELPEVDGDVWVWPSVTKTLCYCPKCRKVHVYFPFELWALERARDCEEYEKLEAICDNFPRLARRLARGERKLGKGDFGYVVERVESARDLRLLEEYFDIPEEVRARIVAKII